MEARHCNEADSPGLYQLNGRAGSTTAGQLGAWVWEPGPGAGVIGATIKAKLRNAGGWSAQLYALRRDGTSLVFGEAPSEEEFRVFNLLAPSAGPTGASRLVAHLKCYRASGCDLNALGGATNRPDNVQLTIRDWRAPAASVTGPMVDSNAEERWHRGIEAATITAHDDGAGVAAWGLRIDGRWAQLAAEPCPGDRGAFAASLQPCPLATSRSFDVDTRSLGAGVRSLEFCVRDYGAPEGNLGCSRPYSIRIDNEAPLQPENLEVAGGEAVWHAENDFNLSWVNPSQLGAAPIAAVRYRILNADGTVVVPMARIANSTPSLADIAVPSGPGLYTIEVSLEDAAGNVGAPARASLRFDDVRPGPAPPVVTSQWLSRTEIPFVQTIQHPQPPHPVSGIAGYAYAVDQQPVSDPCGAADRCTASETDLRDGIDGDSFPIADLAEGTNHVHTVAVSRSGMKSTETGHGVLRVDKTDPVTELQGVPSSWTSEDIPLTARASDALSGMDATGSAAPFTAIRVDGGPPITSPGDSVSTVVAGEGVHTISYYARDVAGNVNDGQVVRGIQNRQPRTAVVRIDRTEPGVFFANSQDPEDPEMIRAVVTDALSGPSGRAGGIAFRRVGGPPSFRPLPTELEGGVMQARWNSDAYPAGEYEFRAWAADQAGNTAASNRRADGRAMVLPNPLKVPTAIRAGLTVRNKHLGKVRSRSVSYASRVRFSGRLTAGLGSPLGGQTVTIIERFAAGARLTRRVSSARTDAKGLFSRQLAPGPKRRVFAMFDGTRTLTRSTSATSAIRTASKLSLRVSSHTARIGGRPIVFSGRVGRRLAAIPGDGKDIELQFRVGSLGWTAFRSLESNGNGDWRFAYRFVDDESRGVRFMFRAVATPETGWPYARAVSRPQSVWGR